MRRANRTELAKSCTSPSGMTRPVPQAAGFALAAAVAVFSHCAPRSHTSVLIRMIKNQETYFRSEVVSSFARENRVSVDVGTYSSTDSLDAVLASRSDIGIVKIPFDKSTALAQAGLIRPLEDFLTKEEIDELTGSFVLTSLGKLGDRHYYVPRKYETRIMVYRKSKVADALASWQKHRPAIDSAIREVNGRGLPAGYSFEEDPNGWDYFDVFTAGWVWAHTLYGDRAGPRIAHRGRRYSGTSLRIVDRVFQCGGDSSSVLSMSGDPVIDAFHWEAVYAASSIYNPRMWTEAWSGTEIWQGFKDGEVFLAFMTQLDCFFIHGTGQDSLEGYLEDPDDMGVALMPTGCAMELDPEGRVARPGTKSVTTGGWWWGIPRTAADPRLSYRLIRHLTSTGNQIQECTRFGMIPVRKDILSDMSMMFGGGWITEVYETSFKQLVENRYSVVPTNPHFAEISNFYLDAWFDIVVERNWSADRLKPDRSHIVQVLAGYERRARAVLKP